MEGHALHHVGVQAVERVAHLRVTGRGPRDHNLIAELLSQRVHVRTPLVRVHVGTGDRPSPQHLTQRGQHLCARDLPAGTRGTVRLLPHAQRKPVAVRHRTATDDRGVVIQRTVEPDRDRFTQRHVAATGLPLYHIGSNPRIRPGHRPVQVVSRRGLHVRADRRIEHVGIHTLRVHPARNRMHRRAIHVKQLPDRARLVVDVDLAFGLAVVHQPLVAELAAPPLLLQHFPNRLLAQSARGRRQQRPWVSQLPLTQIAHRSRIHRAQLGQHVQVDLVRDEERLLAAVFRRGSGRAGPALAASG